MKERGEGEGVKEQLPIYQVRIYLIIFSFPVYIKTLFSDNILFQKYFKNFAISLQKLTKKMVCCTDDKNVRTYQSPQIVMLKVISL